MARRSSILALGVLAALSGSAAAAPPEEVTPEMGAVPFSIGTISAVDTGDGNSTRTAQLTTVFDTVDLNGDGTPAYAGFQKSYCGDWGAFDLPRVGPGVAGPRPNVVEEVYFGVSEAVAGGAQLHDVVITFFDNPKNWEVTTAGTGGFQAAATTIVGSIKIALPVTTSSFPNFNIWQIQNLSQLSSAIILTDTFTGFTIDIYKHGTTTRDTNAYNIFNLDVGGPVTGWSDDRFAQDTNSNGIIPETEMVYTFTGVANPANMFLRVDTLYCDSDFDGTGFTDTDDFDAMVHAYEAGC